MPNNNYVYVLPVLFLEYLAISITRSILPGMMIEVYGDWIYIIVGIIESVKGIFAFIACPIFGKVSDRFGRRYCLIGTFYDIFLYFI